jgi:hypothetical protein
MWRRRVFVFEILSELSCGLIYSSESANMPVEEHTRSK